MVISANFIWLFSPQALKSLTAIDAYQQSQLDLAHTIMYY